MTDNLKFPELELRQLESEFTFKSDDVYYYNTHRPASLVQKLQMRNKEFDANMVPIVFEKALNEKLESYTPSHFAGTGHVIYFVKTKSGKELVLRATHGLNEPENYMDMERDVIQMYKKAGIPSVEILCADTTRRTFEFDYQIMKPLIGKDPEIEWNGTQDDYDELSFDLGRMCAKQYQIPGIGWGRWRCNTEGMIVGTRSSQNEYLNSYLDHDLRVIALFGTLDNEATQKIKEYFVSSEIKSLFADLKQSYFIHHDLADHNIRYEGRKVLAFFDWECSVIHDPISDLASAPTWKVQYPREQKMTEGFLAELGYKPDNFEAKVGVYLLRTMLWKVAFALKGKRLAEKHVNFLSDAFTRCGLDVKVNREWLV